LDEDPVASIGFSKVCTRGLVSIGYSAKIVDEDPVTFVGVSKNYTRELVSIGHSALLSLCFFLFAIFTAAINL
jgi:hypothetical protein